MPDLKGMTVEELCEKALYTRLAAYEIARRLEEAQQKIVELQGAAKHAMYFIRIHHWNEGYPGDGYWDLDAAGTAYEFLKECGFSALTAHDAELTAKAKAEALEEARKDYNGVAGAFQAWEIVKHLTDKAAEYRAKAGRKE